MNYLSLLTSNVYVFSIFLGLVTFSVLYYNHISKDPTSNSKPLNKYFLVSSIVGAIPILTQLLVNPESSPDLNTTTVIPESTYLSSSTNTGSLFQEAINPKIAKQLSDDILLDPFPKTDQF